MTLKLTAMLGPAPLIEEAETALPDMPGCLFAACELDGWDVTQMAQACAAVAQGLEAGIKSGKQHEAPPQPQLLPPPPPGLPAPRGPVPELVEEIARALDPDAWARLDDSLAKASAVLAVIERRRS